MKRILPFLCILSVLFSFTGCGYSVSSTLPSRLKTIHVELFKNAIDFSQTNSRNLYVPMLEVDARNAIIQQYSYDGRLKITDPDMADLILKGELKGYARQTLRYTENNDTQEYRVQITVSLKLWDTKKQELMWEEPGLVGEATYFVTGSQATTEESAIKEAIKDLARRVVEHTIEYW